VYNINPIIDNKGRLKKKFKLGNFVSNIDLLEIEKPENEKLCLPEISSVPGELLKKLRVPSLFDGIGLNLNFEQKKKNIRKVFASVHSKNTEIEPK
jgi:hypothetical protein